jgi:hypothetical protein
VVEENALIKWRLNLALNSAPDEDGGCVDVWELAPPCGVGDAGREHFRKHIPQGYHLASYARLDDLRAKRADPPRPTRFTGSSSAQKESSPNPFVVAWAGGLGAAVALALADSTEDPSSSGTPSGYGGDTGGGGASGDW